MSRYPEPGLPTFVKVIIPLDLLGCMVRLMLNSLLMLGMNRGNAPMNVVNVVSFFVSVQALMVGFAVGGALAILAHKRYGLFLYRMSNWLLYLALAIQGFGAFFALAIGNGPFPLVVFAIAATVSVCWLQAISAAVAQAERLFRFIDAPREIYRLDLPSLTSYSNLRALSLASNPRIRDEDCVLLGSLDTLELLDLSGTDLTDRGACSLERLVHLKSLNLDGTKVGEGIFAMLSRMPALQHVRLNGTRCSVETIEAYEKERWNREPSRKPIPEFKPEKPLIKPPATTNSDAAFDAFLSSFTPNAEVSEDEQPVNVHDRASKS